MQMLWLSWIAWTWQSSQIRCGLPNYMHTFFCSEWLHQESRQRVVRALLAVSQFRSAKYAEAMNAFLELNINPAKIVALFPESVSGRLSVPEEDWIHLFGGPASEMKSDTSSSTGEAGDNGTESVDAALPTRPPSPQGSIRGLLRSGLESVRPVARKEDELETAAMKNKRKECM
jgi:Vam6/Vps39-like protein vacuolar protein sorting-associated protein 39